MVRLSKRLTAIARMVTPGSRLADVGTDHGYVPVWLAKEGRIPSAVAMDIRPGPLARARARIADHGLSGCIETRLGDGLAPLRPGEADTVLIAGMGGELIVRILKEGAAALAGVRELVLSPHSESWRVRGYLEEAGWVLDREAFVEEDGKYYPILHAVPVSEHGGDEGRMSLEELYFGPRLLAGRHPVLREYLNREERAAAALADRLAAAGTPRAGERLKEVQWYRDTVRRALAYYEEKGPGSPETEPKAPCPPDA